MSKSRSPLPTPYSLLPIPFSLLIVPCSLLIVLLSCKSVPPVYEVPPKALPLDEGASVYICAYAKEAAPIISFIPINILENKEVKMLMDKTEYFCAALFPVKSKKIMQISAFGDYPSAGVRMALGANKNWKKMKSDWYSDMKRTSVHITPKLAFASVWESDPENPVSSSLINYPEGLDKDAPLSCWIDDPGKIMSDFTEKLNIPLQFPIEKIFAAFFVEDNSYRVNLKLKFANTSHARALTGIINMARLFAGQDISGDDVTRMLFKLFFSRAPAQNDNYVIIDPPLLNESGMKILFNFLFAAY
jgi:hypothetical protein